MINRPLAALSAMFIALATGATLSQPAQASPTIPPDPALKQTISDNEKVAKGPAEIKRGHVDIGPRIVDGKFSSWPVTTPRTRQSGATLTTLCCASRTLRVSTCPTMTPIPSWGTCAGKGLRHSSDPRPKSRLAGLEHPSPRDRQKFPAWSRSRLHRT